MRKFTITILSLVLVAGMFSCKKESSMSKYGDADKIKQMGEAGIKALPVKQAMDLAKKRNEEKKGGKGLLERSITSGNPAEFAFAIGANLAELQFFYALAGQEGAMNMFKDSLGFFVQLVQTKSVYPGDLEDLRRIISNISNNSNLTVEFMEQELTPFTTKVIQGISNTYGDEGRLNLTFGIYTYGALCYTLMEQVDTAKMSQVFGGMKQYLEAKNASNGTTYNACVSFLNGLNAPSLDYKALGTNATTILKSYMF